MALIFMDSCGDHYNTSYTSKKWTSVGAHTIVAGRTGNALRIGGNNFVLKTLPSSYSEVYFGCALYMEGSSAGIVRLGDHVNLTLSAGSLLGLTCEAGSYYSTELSPLSTWIYVEIKAVIFDTVGSIELKVNGVTKVSQTGIDTKTGATTGVTYLLLRPDNNDCRFDDLYLCDNSGSINNTFRGDCKVEVLYPTASGYSTQFTPYPALTSNYADVDETSPDDDTTYVYASGVGLLDSYTFSNLTTLSGSVYGVQVLPYMRKDDAGSKSATHLVYYSGVSISGTTVSLNNTYTYHSEIYDTSPFTANAWTIDEVNALEFGVTVVS